MKFAPSCLPLALVVAATAADAAVVAVKYWNQPNYRGPYLTDVWPPGKCLEDIILNVKSLTVSAGAGCNFYTATKDCTGSYIHLAGDHPTLPPDFKVASHVCFVLG